MYLAIPQPCPSLSSNLVLVLGYFLAFACALLLLAESALFFFTAHGRRAAARAFGVVALIAGLWCGFVGYGAWVRRFWSEAAAQCGFFDGPSMYTARDVVLWQGLTVATVAGAFVALIAGGVWLLRPATARPARLG